MLIQRIFINFIKSEQNWRFYFDISWTRNLEMYAVIFFAFFSILSEADIIEIKVIELALEEINFICVDFIDV